MVEKYFDQENPSKAKAIYELVSEKAGECEAIPPEEWNVTLRDGVNQDCSQMRSGGIAGEGRSVANEIGYFLRTKVRMAISGGERLYCLPPKSESNFSTYVESACWPSNNPILDRYSSVIGNEDNSVRLTMKLPLMECWAENTTFPIENVTVVADLPLCIGNAGPWASEPTSGSDILDLSTHILDRDVFKEVVRDVSKEVFMIMSVRFVAPPLHELDELLDGLLE